jgi:WD40 repeat protein
MQEWKAHEGHIWAMSFSRDGRYLASGGQDGIVRVWEVHCSRYIPCCVGAEHGAALHVFIPWSMS